MKVPCRHNFRSSLISLSVAFSTSAAILFFPPVCTANPAYSKPRKDEIVRRFDKKIAKLIGKCTCTLDPSADDAAGKPLGQITVQSFRNKEMSISVVSEEYALRLFQEMTMQKKIPFGFPEDGCFARAHEMAFQLSLKGIVSDKGIATGKIFASGLFRLANEQAAKGAVSWSFHVAPFVIVDTGKEHQIRVIDPSLFYEPVALKEWLEALVVHSKAKLKSVYLTNRFVYHPSDRNRDLTDFDPDDLRKSHKLMKRYLKGEQHRTRKHSPDL